MNDFRGKTQDVFNLFQRGEPVNVRISVGFDLMVAIISAGDVVFVVVIVIFVIIVIVVVIVVVVVVRSAFDAD